MTTAEREALRSEMLGASHYLEYGAGVSTQMAVACNNIKAIYSVESDTRFVDETLAKDPAIAAAQTAGRLRFGFINLGPTRKWGFPQNRSRVHLWPNYALAGYVQLANWDLILVDGRFRVACVLLAALEAPSARVLVHDFSDRPEYRVMLHFMKIARKVDTLVLLQRREDFNSLRAQRILRKYLYAADDRVGFERFRYLVKGLWLRATRRSSAAIVSG